MLFGKWASDEAVGGQVLWVLGWDWVHWVWKRVVRVLDPRGGMDREFGINTDTLLYLK